VRIVIDLDKLKARNWWLAEKTRYGVASSPLRLRGGSTPSVSQEDAAMANENMLDWNITLDQVTEVMRGEIRKAVDKNLDFFQKSVSSYPLGDTELGGKAKDCAEKNLAIARDYVHKLIEANNIMEVVPIQTEFMQSQLGLLSEQIKSLGEIYTKAATEVLNTRLTKIG
jgi:hypothetical protein